MSYIYVSVVCLLRRCVVNNSNPVNFSFRKIHIAFDGGSELRHSKY